MPNSKEVDVRSLVRKSGISFPTGVIKLPIKPERKKLKSRKKKSNRIKPPRKRLSMRNKETLRVKNMEVLGKKIDINNNGEVVLGGGKRRKRKRKCRRKTKKKRKMRKRKTKRRR